jgi:DNA-binding XRE family transcriptional regulator
MLSSRPPRVIRTTLDLANAKQVKSVRKRLKISDADLVRIVEKIGNSLSAIEKEVQLERLELVEQCSGKGGLPTPG